MINRVHTTTRGKTTRCKRWVCSLDTHLWSVAVEALRPGRSDSFENNFHHIRLQLQKIHQATHEIFVVALDKRLLNAPHCHLIGLMEGKEDFREEGSVHLEKESGDVCYIGCKRGAVSSLELAKKQRYAYLVPNLAKQMYLDDEVLGAAVAAYIEK